MVKARCPWRVIWLELGTTPTTLHLLNDSGEGLIPPTQQFSLTIRVSITRSTKVLLLPGVSWPGVGLALWRPLISICWGESRLILETFLIFMGHVFICWPCTQLQLPFKYFKITNFYKFKNEHACFIKHILLFIFLSGSCFWFWVMSCGGARAGYRELSRGCLGWLTNVNWIFPVFQHFRDNEHIDICSVLPLLVLWAKTEEQRKNFSLQSWDYLNEVHPYTYV